MKLSPLPLLNSHQGTVHFKISYIFNDKECLACKDEVPDSKKSNNLDGTGGMGGNTNNGIVIKVDRCKALAGDIKIEFYSKNMVRNRKKLFSFWFNTYFVSDKGSTGM